MSREWKRVYDKSKLTSWIKLAGIFLITPVTIITILYGYNKISTEIYEILLFILTIAFGIFSYFYLTEKVRRKPTTPYVGKLGGGMKSLKDLVNER